MSSVNSVLDYAGQLRTQPFELAWFLFTDGQHQLKNKLEITNYSEHITVPTRKVVCAAHPATRGVILVHNHPSGSTWPSKADLLTTQRLALLCHLLDMPLLDHVVVTKFEHFSFRQAQLLEELDNW